MRIQMDKDGNVIKAEKVTEKHPSGIQCSRNSDGQPVLEAGQVAQAVFDASVAERLVEKERSNDFNGEELVTAPKFVGEE